MMGGMDKTDDTRLWMDQGGMVLCEQHSGRYLRAAIAENPRADRHVTPLGFYELLGCGGEVEPVDGYRPDCERCR